MVKSGGQRSNPAPGTSWPAGPGHLPEPQLPRGAILRMDLLAGGNTNPALHHSAPWWDCQAKLKPVSEPGGHLQTPEPPSRKRLVSF